MLRLFICLLCLFNPFLLSNVFASQSIAIQLNTQHGFQYAGYYAAIKQGFYADLGLDVELKVYDPDKDPIEQVIKGYADYGVSDSRLAIYHLQGEPVVLIQQFLQHSSRVFITKKSMGEISPYDFSDKRILIDSAYLDDAPLDTLLEATLNVGPFPQNRLNDEYIHSSLVEAFDVIATDIMSVPALERTTGVEFNIIEPKDYSVDFYGDNFYTSLRELNQHPERVEKMREATLKGWQYALSEPEEMVYLIKSKYLPQAPYSDLLHAAATVKQMVSADETILGTSDPARYRSIAYEYQRLGFTYSNDIKPYFFHHKSSNHDFYNLLNTVEKEWIKNNKNIRYGAERDWAPYDFINQEGLHDGLVKDFLNLISEMTDLNFSPVVGDWEVLLNATEAGELDLLPAIYLSESRRSQLNFTAPYQEVLDYLFIREDVDAVTVSDLIGKTIAVTGADLHIEFIKQKLPLSKVIEVDTLTNAIDKVLNGEADVLFESYSVMNYLLKKRGIKSIRPFHAIEHNQLITLHMATPKNHDVLVGILNKALKAIPETEKQLLYSKWLGYQPRSTAQKFSLTDEETQWLKMYPRIRLGADQQWPPYEFIDESGVLQGFSAEIIDLIEQRLDIEFELTPLSDWQTTVVKAQSKQIDITSGMTQTDERLKYFNFSAPYYSPPLLIYSRKGEQQIEGVKDLFDKTIAIENQYFLHQYFLKTYPNINLITFKTTAEALSAVSYGQADVYIGDQGAANWAIENNALSNLYIAAVFEQENAPLSFAIRKDWPMLLTIIDKAIASISEVEVAAIRRKWLGLNNTSKRLPLNSLEKQWLTKNNTIQLVGRPQALPYEAFDESGNYIGIIAEYVTLIEQRLGIQFEVQPQVSPSHSIQGIQDKSQDMIVYQSNVYPDIDLTFTDPLIKNPVVVVMQNDEAYVNNLRQLRGRIISIVKGSDYAKQIQQAYPLIDFVEVATIEQGLSSVSTGKTDALLTSLAQSSYYIAELSLHNIRVVGKTRFNAELAFGVRPELSALVPLLNKALSSITLEERANSFKAWAKQDYVESTNYDLPIRIGIVFLCILVIVIYWNRKLRKEIIYREKLENQTQELIERIPLQIIVTSISGDILTANPKALLDYQIKEKELNQYNISDFYADPNDAKTLKQELQNKGRIKERIVPFNRPDGIAHFMMVSVMPITFHDRDALLSIAVDMSERLEIERALKLAKDSAERASHAKSEFLANMSHEIRTPMNAIIGFTELLNDQVKEPKLKSFVKTIQSAGNNLLELINDILDLSKIEAGKLNIELKAANPHDLFADIGDIFTIAMRKNDLEFILDIAPDIPDSLMLDALRLRQVLFNLVGNAVKFTEKGSVKIKARTVNENTVRSTIDFLIDVEDTGVGISFDQQKIIFEEFEQTKEHNTHLYGGTGLGLSISKRLVKMMGGDLSLKSELGKGSIFTISLKGIDVASLSVEEEQTVTEKASDIVFFPANVLIVDDVEDNRKLLSANFEETDLTLYQAKNGLEACHLHEQHDIDLILMDIRMPVMDGYEAAKQIKSVSNVPIVALTASVMTDQFERRKSDDFDGYLRKPVLKAELYKAISAFLSFKKVLSEDKPETLRQFSEQELIQLPNLLSHLYVYREELAEIYKSNNIESIRVFSDRLKALGEKYEFIELLTYQQQLQEHIESFDIIQIKQSLDNFERLIACLESGS